MQLATSRVNFTNSSVAQYNYVKLLNKPNSAERGVHNILTVLGLHSDDFALVDLDTKVRRARRKFYRKTTLLENDRTLVPYVRKTMTINMDRAVEWFRIVIFNTKRKFCETLVEWDMRSGVIKVAIRRDSDHKCLYDVKISSLFKRAIPENSIERNIGNSLMFFKTNYQHFIVDLVIHSKT